MIQPELKKAFVRIICGSSVLGNGFLVAPRHVVTCAHVVRRAGVDPESRCEGPSAGLQVQFHWLEKMPVVGASLAPRGWRYEKGVIDIAVIELAGSPEVDVSPLRLASVARHAFKAELEPYIPALGSSRRIEAAIDGCDENGRLILVPIDASRQWVDAGVSGSAVLGLDSELVEGMVMRDDVEVKQAFVVPARLIQQVLDVAVAEAAFDGAAVPVDAVDALSARRGEQRSVSTSTNADLVAVFLGNDPVAGDDAIDPLAARGASILTDLLARGASSRQQIVRMRKLCARIGRDALAPLIAAIRTGPWHAKCAAAPCLAAFQDGSANGELYELLKVRDFDVQRLAIEATGHSGYSSNMRWDLARLAKYDQLERESSSRLISDYSFGKLFTYVVEALGRGFARSGGVGELRDLKEFVELCRERKKEWEAVQSLDRSFEDLTPAAADALIAEWLPQQEGPYGQLALAALGRLRLRRTSAAAIPFLFDSRDDVRREAAICLGGTGDEATARAVAEALSCRESVRQQGADVNWAISMLYARAADWELPDGYLEATLEGASEVAVQLLVSAAQRHPEMIVERARRGLSNTDSFVRAGSALALAWARPAVASNLLDHADDEAADGFERLAIVAAQVLAGRFKRGPALHAALREEIRWPLIRPFWRYQVLAALSLAELDQRYAYCWAEVSQDDAPRFQALIALHARRAAPERAATTFPAPTARRN